MTCSETFRFRQFALISSGWSRTYFRSSMRGTFHPASRSAIHQIVWMPRPESSGRATKGKPRCERRRGDDPVGHVGDVDARDAPEGLGDLGVERREDEIGTPGRRAPHEPIERGRRRSRAFSTRYATSTRVIDARTIESPAWTAASIAAPGVGRQRGDRLHSTRWPRGCRRRRHSLGASRGKFAHISRRSSSISSTESRGSQVLPASPR